jgi:hypothetical protein
VSQRKKGEAYLFQSLFCWISFLDCGIFEVNLAIYGFSSDILIGVSCCWLLIYFLIKIRLFDFLTLVSLIFLIFDFRKLRADFSVTTV